MNRKRQNLDKLLKKAFQKKRKIVVGITGGISTGKSLVAMVLARRGAGRVDADAIAREVVRPGSSCLQAICRAFGPAVIQRGRLDRKRLGQIVFSSPAKRRCLEGILHPAILKVMRQRLAESRCQVVAAEIPLLFEKKLESMVDLIMVVWAPRRLQERRLMTSMRLSAPEARRRLKAQWPLEKKIKKADVVFQNDGKIGDFVQQVNKFWDEYLTRNSDSGKL